MFVNNNVVFVKCYLFSLICMYVSLFLLCFIMFHVLSNIGLSSEKRKSSVSIRKSSQVRAQTADKWAKVQLCGIGQQRSTASEMVCLTLVGRGGEGLHCLHQSPCKGATLKAGGDPGYLLGSSLYRCWSEK